MAAEGNMDMLFQSSKVREGLSLARDCKFLRKMGFLESELRALKCYFPYVEEGVEAGVMSDAHMGLEVCSQCLGDETSYRSGKEPQRALEPHI